ncbi:hypothetical protein [Thalassolituus oleivorans]|jgi:hypothetical protein|uniref:hypothetical protein n=1 Tax=Thalassolituus oleivorans TaxID=187493 RepID=UPI0023F0144C|nr:hypothetical protein [Thalassolituus oleivorans]
MKRPTWATIVGVLAITFGIMGIFSGAKDIAMPSILEMQKEMMMSFSNGKTPDGKDLPQITWEFEKDGEKQKIEISKMFEGAQEQFQFPDWYKSWAVVIGLVSIAAATLYLFSGIFLLMKKPLAVKVFYVTISVSIAWACIQTLIFAQSGNGMLMAEIPMFIPSILIDIILLIVVLTGNKDAFNAEQS